MKSKVWKIGALCLAGLVLLSSLSAVIYCGVIGAKTFDEGAAAIKALFVRENDVFYRKSYTVSDRKAAAKRDQVVATAGGQELTNGQLQVCFWMNFYDYVNNNGSYAAYAGLDYTQPLDKQTHASFDGTWQQYFLDDALDNWHTYTAMAILAKDRGLKLNDSLQSNLDSMREKMEKTALGTGFKSLDAMIQSDMGAGCTFEDYYEYMYSYYLGYMYYTDCYADLQITDAMIEEYFNEHETELAENKITKTSGDLVDIRQILIVPEGGIADENDNMTYTDDAWAKAKSRAEKVLEEWNKGAKTEQSFIDLVVAHSDNDTAQSDGGLVENIFDGYLTGELDAWCFAEDRKAGDCDLVKTQYGYHIVYFVCAEPEWYRECSEGVVSELADGIMLTAKRHYPLTVDYSKIVLGEVDLSDD